MAKKAEMKKAVRAAEKVIEKKVEKAAAKAVKKAVSSKFQANPATRFIRIPPASERRNHNFPKSRFTGGTTTEQHDARHAECNDD